MNTRDAIVDVAVILALTVLAAIGAVPVSLTTTLLGLLVGARFGARMPPGGPGGTGGAGAAAGGVAALALAARTFVAPLVHLRAVPVEDVVAYQREAA